MANAATNASSNSLVNAVVKLKQMFYNAGANSDTVSDALDRLCEKEISLRIGPNSTTIGYTVPVGAAYQLTNAIFCPTVLFGNAAANTVLVNIATNAASVLTFNSESLSANVAVGSVAPLTLTTTNSFLDSGETILVTTTCDQSADGAGTLVLRMKPVTHGS